MNMIQFPYQTSSIDGPEIQPLGHSEVVKVGKDVSLTCTAEGNPVPVVKWSFQNQNKTTGRRQTILTIFKATSADAGEYTCTATNDFGNVTRTVTLSVTSKSDVIAVKRRENVINGILFANFIYETFMYILKKQ